MENISNKQGLINLLNEALMKKFGYLHNSKKAVFQYCESKTEEDIVTMLIDVRFNRIKVSELRDKVLR